MDSLGGKVGKKKVFLGQGASDALFSPQAVVTGTVPTAQVIACSGNLRSLQAPALNTQHCAPGHMVLEPQAVHQDTQAEPAHPAPLSLLKK